MQVYTVVCCWVMQVSATWWCRCLLLGDAVICYLAMQVFAAWLCRCLQLGYAGAGLQMFAAWWWRWLLLGSAGTGDVSISSFCIVVLGYLPKGVVRRPEMILWRLSEIALKRDHCDFRKLALKKTVWEKVVVISWLLISAVLGLWLWLVEIHVGCWLLVVA